MLSYEVLLLFDKALQMVVLLSAAPQGTTLAGIAQVSYSSSLSDLVCVMLIIAVVYADIDR